MKLSKQRQVYVAIMGLGLAAVAVDRLWLSAGPSHASAAATPQELASATPPAKPVSDAAVVSISKRLETAQASLGTDAFVIPASWQPPAPPPEAEAAESHSEPSAQKHQVTSVVGGGAAIAAVIDGEVIRLGETGKNGITLVSVDGRRVTIQIADKQMQLTIDSDQRAR